MSFPAASATALLHPHHHVLGVSIAAAAKRLKGNERRHWHRRTGDMPPSDHHEHRRRTPWQVKLLVGILATSLAGLGSWLLAENYQGVRRDIGQLQSTEAAHEERLDHHETELTRIGTNQQAVIAGQRRIEARLEAIAEGLRSEGIRVPRVKLEPNPSPNTPGGGS